MEVLDPYPQNQKNKRITKDTKINSEISYKHKIM